jgi:hypothetical protein
MKQWMQQNTGQDLDIQPAKIILGDKKPASNFITTLTKMYIYACKMKKIIPRADEAIKKIEETKEVEKIIAIKNGTEENFMKKWGYQ